MKNKDYTIGYYELENTVIPPDYKKIERELQYAFAAFMGLGVGAVIALLMIFWGMI